MVKAPIIVLVQLHPSNSERKDFESRIKGGKSIFMPSTVVLELKRVEDEYESDWIFHKNRWGNIDHNVRTKWEKGKYGDPS